MVEDSHEGLRALLHEEGVPCQALKTWKESNDPDFEAKKNRIPEHFDLADGRPSLPRAIPTSSCATTSSGRSTSNPTPGTTGPSVTSEEPDDQVGGRAGKVKKGRTESLASLRYVRSLHPPGVRIAVVLDNFSPHLSTKTDARVGEWARANNVELAYTPHCASWLNRIPGCVWEVGFSSW